MFLDVVTAMREFHQFYTEFTITITQSLFSDDINLPETRVFLEVACNEPLLASHITDRLNLDRGHVSRILSRLEAHGLIQRGKELDDARKRIIRLTPEGRDFFNERNDIQQRVLARGTKHWNRLDQEDLVDALTRARLLLSQCTGQEEKWQFRIRPFRTGDIGLIASRQSRSFATSQEQSQTLELLESEISTAFLRNFNPANEQCFLAEIGITMVGAIVIINSGGGTACIHLLHVEHFARGRGIGNSLLVKALKFAGEKGYKEITLTLHPGLKGIREICIRNGFRNKQVTIHAEPEVWSKDLTI